MDGIVLDVIVQETLLQNVVMVLVMVMKITKAVRKIVMNRVVVMAKLLTAMVQENAGLQDGLVMDSQIALTSSMAQTFVVMI